MKIQLKSMYVRCIDRMNLSKIWIRWMYKTMETQGKIVYIRCTNSTNNKSTSKTTHATVGATSCLL